MTNDRFNQAQQLVAQGLFNEALTLLKSIEHANINNPNYWFFMGICHASLAQFTDASNDFKKAVKLAPQSVQAWSNLGLSYLQQQKYPEAINAFQKAISIDSNFIDALYNMAITYHKTARLDKAMSYARRALMINPNHFQAHNISGLCTQANDFVRSETSFKTAIELNSHYYDAWHNLIDTYILHKKNAEAEHVLKNALSLFSKNIALYKTLGKLYEAQNAHDKAITTYHHALGIEPQHTEIQVAMARSHLALSAFDECERLLEQVLQQNPEQLDALIEKSSLLVVQRKYQQAHDILSPVIAKGKDKPGLIIVYAKVCKLLKNPDSAIPALLELTQKKLPKNVTEPACFALADIYDQQKNYDEAFQQYQSANSVFQEITDIHYYQKVISSLIKNLNKETLATLPHSGNTAQTPVFIVGMPRSGTTLVEQILSSHPAVYGAGEITDLWAIGNKISGAMHLNNYAKNIKTISCDEIEQYSLAYLKTIQQLSGQAVRCTDKLPHNFFHIGLIELLFPNAKIIHCSRNPFDTCLSIYFKKFNDNHRYARNLKEIALFYKNYQRLMQHWRDNSRLEIYEAVYENLIIDPEKNIRELVQHIGLDWHDACLKHHESKRLIMTPSHDQASQPLYTRSLNRWKNYNLHLQPLIDILGEPENNSTHCNQKSTNN